MTDLGWALASADDATMRDLAGRRGAHPFNAQTCRGARSAGAARRPSSWGRYLLAGVAAVSFSPVALAQTTPAAPAAAAGNDSTLQEIVVTAQRRNENLQSVPVTVNALSANALAQQNITTGLDVAKLVPAISVAPSNGTVQIFIRGIGNTVDATGNEPSDALYIDGVYYSRLVSNLLRFNNIDRIEVLKGPQGTLFGRNAEGGLLQIVTRSPVPGSALSGAINVGYGSFSTVDAGGYISSGIGDKLAIDIAADYYDNEGFGHDVLTGARVNYEHARAVRSKLVYEPQDGTRITLAGDYSRSNTDIGISGQRPGSPFPNTINTYAPDGSGLLPRIGYYDTNLNSPRNYFAEEYGGSLRIEQKLGFAKLISITAYHRNNEVFTIDSDFGPQDNSRSNLPQFEKQFTQEVQLQSNPGSAVDWTVGAFYLNIKTGYKNSIIRDPSYSPPGSELVINSNAPVQSYAGYGQATVKLVPKVKLTVGARVSRDDVTGNGKIDVLFDNGFLFNAAPFAELKKSETRLTGKGVLSYQADDNVLAYASASRGYKSGLYNILTFSAQAPYVKAEVLDAFELGVKSELFDKTLRFNAAIFYNSFKNPQVQNVQGHLLFLQNANHARSYGAEFDAQWVVTHQLTVMAGGSYINAKYTDYPAAPFYTLVLDQPPPPAVPLYATANARSADGKYLPDTPNFAGNIGFLYKIPAGDGRFLINGNYAYTGRFFWTAENRYRQNGYGLLDARIAYEFKNGLTLSVWGSNLTGAKYQIQGQTDSGYTGDLGAPGAPRQYGVKATVKF